MYGMHYLHYDICLIFLVNVGRYTIHGLYGVVNSYLSEFLMSISRERLLGSMVGGIYFQRIHETIVYLPTFGLNFIV